MSGEPRKTGSTLGGARWNALNRFGLQLLRSGLLLGLAWILEDPAKPEQSAALLGVLGSVMLIRELLDMVGDFGVGQAVVRQKELDDGFLAAAMTLNVLIGGVLFVALLALAPLASLWFHEFDPELLTGVLRGLALAFLLSWLGVVHRGLLLRELRFDWLAAINLSGTGFVLVVSLAGAWAGYGIWGYVVGQVGSSLGQLAALLKLSPFRPRISWQLSELAPLWGFMRNLLGFNFLNFWTINMDRAAVGRLGDVALGHYSLTLRLVLYPARMITSSLSAVLVSAFSRLQDDDAALRDRILRSLGTISLIAAPISVGLGVLAAPIIGLLLPKSMAPVVTYVQILAPLGLVQALTHIMGSVYLAKGRTDWLLRWSLFTLPIFVGALTYGVRFGVEGVAWALLAAHTTLLPLSLGVPLRLIGLGLKPVVRRVAPSVACAAVMGLGVAGLRTLMQREHLGDLPQLLAGVMTGVAVYVTLVWTLRLQAARELLRVVGLPGHHPIVTRFSFPHEHGEDPSRNLTAPDESHS